MDMGVLTTATAESGDLVKVAQQAEALGFDSLWIPGAVPLSRET